MKVHYSSARSDWETPDDFFRKYDEQFGFETDLCASADNAKCQRFFDKTQNSLTQKWTGVCWMNPPYGKHIGTWMRKAYKSSQDDGATVVCLVPARTDTAWWHDFAMKGEIEFIRGRLKFKGASSNAPFPSAVVVFRARK